MPIVPGKVLLSSIAAVALLTFAAPATSLAGPIPVGWSCSGNCGSDGADGVVTLSPTGNSSYEYVTTNGAGSSTAVLPGKTPTAGGETDGSVLTTSTFAATAGQALQFYFNFVTSDGSSTYADYGWAELLNATTNLPAALLFTGQTEPSGSIVPGAGLAGSGFTPVATLTPPSVPIVPGGPVWSPLGSYSGACFDGPGEGCGYTGWVLSTYDIASSGNYYLEFGATNWSDTLYDTGLAVDGVTIGGQSISPPPPVSGVTPEPSTLVLLGSGFLGLAAALKRRLSH
jgi:hypothetical protein